MRLIIRIAPFLILAICRARDQLLCIGDDLVFYDPAEATCIGGELVTNSITTPGSILVGTCQMEQSNEKLGFKCCGSEMFHPEYDTCCREVDNVYKYRVHWNKTEKDYVCCGLESYKRNSVIPCANSAKNDKFWNNVTILQPKRPQLPGGCFEYMYAFHLRVKGKDELGFETDITRVTSIARTNAIYDRDDMTMRTDKHSPKRSLINRSFLILSDKDHMDQAKIDIYLETDDLVFSAKGGKYKRMRNIIRKLQRWCIKSKNGRKSRRRGTQRNKLMRF